MCYGRRPPPGRKLGCCLRRGAAGFRSTGRKPCDLGEAPCASDCLPHSFPLACQPRLRPAAQARRRPPPPTRGSWWNSFAAAPDIVQPIAPGLRRERPAARRREPHALPPGEVQRPEVRPHPRDSKTPTATARPTSSPPSSRAPHSRWTSPCTPTARSTSPRGTKSSGFATPTAMARPTRRRASSSSTPRATTRTTAFPGCRSTAAAISTSAWARTSASRTSSSAQTAPRSPAAARAATSSTARPTARSSAAWPPASGTRSAPAATSYGRLFVVDNDPDASPPCRMLHVVEGGDYGFQFRYGRAGRHPFQAWNGELPGTLPIVAGTGESPTRNHQLRIRRPARGVPRRHLVPAWADHRVERYVLQPRGASFAGGAQAIHPGRQGLLPVRADGRAGRLAVRQRLGLQELRAARQGRDLAHPLEGRETVEAPGRPEAGAAERRPQDARGGGAGTGEDGERLSVASQRAGLRRCASSGHSTHRAHRRRSQKNGSCSNRRER